MFSSIWHNFFFDPVYNTLVYFIDILPSADVGLAVILSVVVLKVLLLPLSIKASRTQIALQAVQEELKKVQEKYKNSREDLSKHILEIYRREKINPLTLFLKLVIELPLIIALFLTVRALPDIQTDILYTFVKNPELVNMHFFGIIDMTGRNMGLALLAGITSYFQMKYMLPQKKDRKKDAKPDFKEDFADSMRFSMLYVMPVMMVFIGYTFTAVLALYFTVSNIVTLAIEWYIKSKIHKK